jgi:hypothetical protein
MPIDLFTEYGVFEPEATAAMGEAFDAACEELHCATQPGVVRELVAALIIGAASHGELDPISLRMLALESFAICRQHGYPLPLRQHGRIAPARSPGANSNTNGSAAHLRLFPAPWP